MPFFDAGDGTKLHFSDVGAGAPILCLAGLTRNQADFQHVRPHLRGRVICMDYRGRGQSGWADPTSYTVPQEAQDVLALLDHVGLDKVSILGTSRGGLIAMVLAVTAKERLAGVALNDIGPELQQTGLDLIAGYIGHPPEQATLHEAAEARAKAWTGFGAVPKGRWLAEVTGQFEQTDTGLALRYDPALREAVLAAGAVPLPDLWPVFDALDGVPLALIRGANSDLLSAETARKMQVRRPDMIYAEVPERGHVPFLDETEALAALAAWQDTVGEQA